MISCTRRLQFCFGHRVYQHEAKCRHLHGHNYVGFFEAEAPALDEIGRVIDFGVLKQKIGGWIDRYWDHAFVLWSEDPLVNLFTGGPLSEHPLYILPTNPTAENLAEHLLHAVCPVILEGTGVTVTKITLWETENCYAVASLHG